MRAASSALPAGGAPFHRTTSSLSQGSNIYPKFAAPSFPPRVDTISTSSFFHAARSSFGTTTASLFERRHVKRRFAAATPSRVQYWTPDVLRIVANLSVGEPRQWPHGKHARRFGT